MTNRYEMLYLVGGNFTEEELEPVKTKVREQVEKVGGKITLEDSLGKRKLAYPIETQGAGYYLLYEFELEGEELKKLTNALTLMTEVLRHTVVKRDANAPTFREMTRQREQREREHLARQEQAQAAQAPAEEPKPKMTMEVLDEKLDEILQGDIM